MLNARFLWLFLKFNSFSPQKKAFNYFIGGWTLIANISTKVNIANTDDYIKQDTNKLGEMESGALFGLDSIGIKLLKDAINATQLRVYCHKDIPGRTVHIMTNKNKLGLNILKFFSYETSTNPKAFDSYTRLIDDHSVISTRCSN